ncbi:hypothetical protein [Chelativorans salis]|uniref:Uncharacterized protein n=1 Tax=Chelativorans salis TaxID=2978478 RepID=A0ABT2LM41_9HYPH|nr:hypothetical protein [Chelativorans sp. EGI FJ00035]MCT7375630.1 hypothetical protein [Chelativorans sp. EGI FJ00035]
MAVTPRGRALARAVACAAILSLSAAMSLAGEVDVEAVDVSREADGTYRFDVTVAHADEGWDHYADRWEVLSEDGTVLATRVLAHPHVDEQPFTRSLGGITVPAGVTHVVVRARDSVHGHGGNEVRLALPDR